VVFEIKERNVEDVVVLDISGNLDMLSAPQMKVKFESLVSFGHHKLIINLANVDFIDSTGVGSLMYGQKMINPVTGGIRIVGLSPINTNVFSVLNLTEAMNIMKSEEIALGSFHRDGSTIH
jgi:anti-sigma B factor antagonist